MSAGLMKTSRKRWSNAHLWNAVSSSVTATKRDPGSVTPASRTRRSTSAAMELDSIVDPESARQHEQRRRRPRHRGSDRIGINGIEYLKPREPRSDADDGAQHFRSKTRTAQPVQDDVGNAAVSDQFRERAQSRRGRKTVADTSSQPRRLATVCCTARSALHTSSRRARSAIRLSPTLPPFAWYDE